MNENASETGRVTVMDVTGQKVYHLDSMPVDAATIDDVVRRLLDPMKLPNLDSEGRPLTYGLRSQIEGRFLGANERADSVQPNDTLTLMPSIEAG